MEATQEGSPTPSDQFKALESNRRAFDDKLEELLNDRGAAGVTDFSTLLDDPEYVYIQGQLREVHRQQNQLLDVEDR